MFQKHIKYALPGSFVNDITIEDDGFALLFCNGAYVLDDTGKETYLSKPCKMNFLIECFDKNRFFEHCIFLKMSKKAFSEVDLSTVKELLLKNLLK